MLGLLVAGLACESRAESRCLHTSPLTSLCVQSLPGGGSSGVPALYSKIQMQALVFLPERPRRLQVAGCACGFSSPALLQGGKGGKYAAGVQAATKGLDFPQIEVLLWVCTMFCCDMEDVRLSLCGNCQLTFCSSVCPADLVRPGLH